MAATPLILKRLHYEQLLRIQIQMAYVKYAHSEPDLKLCLLGVLVVELSEMITQ
jgi:hypothetical protein